MRINDNGIDRDMTADELAAHEANVAAIEAEAKAEATARTAREKARKAAVAKLKELGLTDVEIAALLPA